jgi:ABC-type taurine transport system substrate-binding protein
MLGLFKSLYKPIVANLVVNWRDLPREDARVPAGEFVGSFKRRATFSFGPYQQTSDGWSHPSVPINGLVRSVGVDKPTTMELVAFGNEGATSVF